MIDHNLIQFAFDKDGKRVSVFDVPYGNQTKCFCRVCNQPLGAKNKGKTRTTQLRENQKAAHFYHLSETGCNGETLVHILAKEVLKEHAKLKFFINVKNQRNKYLHSETREENLDEVVLEPKIDIHEKKYIRPDFKSSINGVELYIEFAYSSFIEYEKENFIKELNLNLIEINLDVSDYEWNEYPTETGLKEKLIEFFNSLEIHSYNWINNHDFGHLTTKVVDTTNAELKQRAEDELNDIIYNKKMSLLKVPLGLPSISYTEAALSFEGKTFHFLKDENFIFEKGNITLTQNTFDELVKLREYCYRDWYRLKV